MKSWKKVIGILTVVGLLAFAAVGPVAGGPVEQGNLQVAAQTSSNGVSPTVPGQAQNQWFYAYCLASGSSLNDTLPVQFKLDDADGTPNNNTVTVNFTAVGSADVKNGISVSSFNISDDGTTVTANISINTAALADGVYNANVQIQAVPPNKAQLSHNTIHIHVFVGQGCSASCYFTSSSFDLLTDCSGAFVGSNNGGTFAIVASGKKITATNPGTFYYNLIWMNNTGSQKQVQVSFSKSSTLDTQGSNSVHAYIFNGSGFVADLAAFQLVNTNGTPCGPSGPCTVTVPAGDVLWVTWHVVYSKIGQSSVGIGVGCANANELISATGTLTDVSDSSQLYQCTATALGYIKPK